MRTSALKGRQSIAADLVNREPEATIVAARRQRGTMVIMETNPYQSPSEFPAPALRAKDLRWHPATWGFIGFAVGTVVASLFVLSHNRVDQAIGGAIFGGLPAGLYTFMRVVEKRRKESDDLAVAALQARSIVPPIVPRP